MEWMGEEDGNSAIPEEQCSYTSKHHSQKYHCLKSQRYE